MSAHSQARRLRREQWSRRIKWPRYYIKKARKQAREIEQGWIAEGLLKKGWRRKIVTENVTINH